MTEQDLREKGKARIREPEHANAMVPLKAWADFPLRFAVEYPVTDFEAEVGFWSEQLGLRFLILSDDYAVCTDEANSFTFAFQEASEKPELSALKIQWFTDELNDAIAYLDEKNVAYQIYFQSSIQRYVRFSSPAGVTVEIWSGEEGHCP